MFNINELLRLEKAWRKLKCMAQSERYQSGRLHTVWFQLYDILGKVILEAVDFPATPVVKNPPARRLRFDPWSKTIPHAAKQLSPCTACTEPAFWSWQATSTELACYNHCRLCPRVCALQQRVVPAYCN